MNSGSNRIKERMNKEHKRTFILLLVLIVLLESCIVHVMYKNELDSERKEAKVYGESVASSIKISLEMSINKSEFMKNMYLEYGDDFLEDFERLVKGGFFSWCVSE